MSLPRSSARMKSLFLNTFRGLKTAFAWVLVLIALFETSPLQAGTIIYVSKSSTGPRDGSSWTGAYHELYDALIDVRVAAATAENPVQIWVAKGTYKPLATAGRMATFAVPGNVSIIGGFAGTETSLNDPRFVGNVTVLSGDIGTTDPNAVTAEVYPFNVQGTNFAFAAGVLDNCYNVVQINNATNVTLSDLVITGGNADGAALLNATNVATEMLSPEESDDDSKADHPQRDLSRLVAGGGLFGVNCQVTLVQVQFINNFAALGGGMGLGTNHNVVAAGCTFQGNYAPAGGGAVLELFANSVMEKCQFLDNQSDVEGGAVKFVAFRPRKEGADEREKALARIQALVQKKAAMVGLGDDVAGTRLTAAAATVTVTGLKSAITGGGINAVEFEKPPSTVGMGLMAYGLAIDILLVALPDGQAREIVEQIHKYATVDGYAEMLQEEAAKLVVEGAEAIGLDDWNSARQKTVTNKRLFLDLFNKQDASLMLQCTFLNNRSEVGGAVSVNYANVSFDGCLFQGNHAGYMGGAVYTATFTVPKFISCVFYQNTSDLGFSAMCNANQSRAQVVNCTFLQNFSSSQDVGHAIGNMLGSEVRVINCILWSNTTPAQVSGGADIFSATATNVGPTTYSMAGEDQSQLVAVTEVRSSCIQSLTNLVEGSDDIIPGCISIGDGDSYCFTTEGGAVNLGEGFRPGTKTSMGNISIYPGFADGFRVLASSPTIDAGDLRLWTNGVIKSVTGLDFNGQTRVKDATIDMGATEGFGFTSRLYVRPGGSGKQNGSSWSNAMSSLSTALRAGKTEIWVAAGTYYPTIGIDRTASFRVTNDVALYGGFAGTETSLSQRNPGANVTILSGDIGTPGVDTDNSYRVIYCDGSVTYRTVIDGFTITKGRGTGPTAGYNSGAAIYCAGVGPRIENCKLIDNSAVTGGAVYTSGIEGPTFVNCQFINNSANEGGAINSGARLRLENCSFMRNTAVRGGALTLGGQYSYIFNSLFVSNSVAGTNLVYGGAIANLSGNCNLYNCTFSRNTATVPSVSSGNGATIYSQTSLSIQNSIFWKNTATNLSGSQPTVEQQQISIISSLQTYLNGNLIEGLSSFLNDNNFDRDPFFVNASGGDFHLAPYSTCIDAGQTNGYINLLTDLDGRPRIAGAGVDVGAYEFQGTATPVSAQIVKVRNCDPGGIVQQFVLNSGANNYGFTSYQWEIDRQDGLGFRTLANDAVHSGATTSTLTLTSPPISMNGFRYRIRASGPLYQYVSSPVVLNAAAPVVYVRANATGNNSGTDWTNAYTTLQAAVGVPNNWDVYQFYPAGTQVIDLNLRYRALVSHVSTQANRPPNASAWAPVLVDECSQIWVAAGTYYISNSTSVPVTSYNVAFTNILDYGDGYYVTNVQTTVVRGTNYIPGNNFAVLRPAFTDNQITVGPLRMRSNLRIYGGFTGTETSLAQRNWRANPTIISGNVGNPADDSDNAANLFANYGNQTGYAVDSTALLDGFTLTKARDTAMLNSSASPTIQNCIFLANNGGGGGAMRNELSASPVLLNCIFTGNTASDGAAIDNSGPTTLCSATNCVFNQNVARYRGGALANSGTMNLVNCVVANNFSDYLGGALFALSGTTKIFNTILWNNRDTANGSLPNNLERMQIEKWDGSVLISNSCVQGLSAYAGNGNILFDPLFVDAWAGNFRLQSPSPAVNTGNSAFANAASVDLAGNPRIFGGSPVDMGAYELQAATSATLTLYSAPESITTCNVGGSATFSVVATPDASRNFVWQKNTGTGFANQSSDSTYVITSSPTNATLAVQNISTAMNGYQFRVIELNSHYTSAPVTLTLAAPRVIYVNVAANLTNTPTGTSWAMAFTNVSSALAIADQCSEIWVAQGAYTNTQPLEMKSGVSILGGFAGTETTREQRNWSNNIAYLRAVNTAVIVNLGNLAPNDHSALLDGFTIQAPAGQQGVFNFSTSPTIRQCTFENHADLGNSPGYAAYNLDSTAAYTGCIFRNNTTRALFNDRSSPRITGCTFQNNVSSKGAIENSESSPVIDRCVFRDNAAPAGCGVYNGFDSQAQITDCLFFHNTASYRGAGVANFGTSVTIVNCTFTENVAPEGGAGLYSQQSDVSIANAIFWKNTATIHNVEEAQISLVLSDGNIVTVSNSCVQGLSTLAGNENISYDPLFLAPDTGNYRLNGNSPAVNSGSSNAAVALSLDLDGNPRAVSVVDMGAYELQTPASSVVRLFAEPASLSVCDGHQVSFNIAGTNVFGTNFVWQVHGAGTNYLALTNDANHVITASSNASTLTILSVNSAMQSDNYHVVETASGFVSALFQITVPSVTVLRVKTNAPAGGDGLNWNTAFNNLDDAFAAAGGCGELWVAQGTYSSTNTLLLKPTMQVFGGFAGTETARSQRNAQTHLTIIQQTIKVNADYGVVLADTMIDGLKFTGAGHVESTDASPTIRNCVFQGLAAPGINSLRSSPVIDSCLFTNNLATAIQNSDTTALIMNCVFDGNVIAGSGAGIYNSGSSPTIVDCVFRNNRAFTGAGIWNFNSSPAINRCRFEGNLDGSAVFNSDKNSGPLISNCSFLNNTSASYGGAIAHYGATLTLVNCTLTLNTAVANGGGIYAQSPINIVNSILWNNSLTLPDKDATLEQAQIRIDGSTGTISNSCVQGLSVFAGNNNIGYDPLLLDAVNGNLQLGDYSPAINAGNNSAISGGALDLVRNSRLFGGVVDMGAIERQTNALGLVQMFSTPSSRSACVGRAATFSAVGTNGSGSTFQWQIFNGASYVAVTNGGDNTITVSSNSSTLNIVASTVYSKNLRLALTGSGAVASSFTFASTTPTVLYVKPANSASGVGTSWATAFRTVQEALAVADGCTDIWVASGTNAAGSSPIQLKSGVQIYGGFAGTETARAQRNWTNNISLLLGSTAKPAVFNDGRSTPLDHTAVLDGFTVQGQGGQSAVFNYAASPTIRNCTFSGNAGPSINNQFNAAPLIDSCTFATNDTTTTFLSTIYNFNASPIITNCLFVGNHAPGSGGAIENNNSAPTIGGCRFVSNSADFNGGAIWNEGNSVSLIVNCLFQTNSASGDGGAIYNSDDASVTLSSCLFAHNSAFQAGAIAQDSTNASLLNLTLYDNHATGTGVAGGGIVQIRGTLQILNSILWRNRDGTFAQNIEQAQFLSQGGTWSISNSCIEALSAYAGNNNLPHDPLFVDPDTQNFQLSSYSPAVNSGNNAAVLAGFTDLNGNSRIFGANVDMGAYELQSAASASPVQLTSTPVSQTSCNGRITRFSTSGVTNTIAAVQWQVFSNAQFFNISNGPTYSITSNGTNSTLTISNTLPGMAGQKYRILINGTSYASATATLNFGITDVIYVKSTGTNGDGRSWATAFNNLASAIAAGDSCSEIWVAAGPYTSQLSLNMKSGLALYGGFNGTEIARSQRDWVNNISLLQSSGYFFDNHTDVTPVDRTAVLDGFTLTAINSDGASVMVNEQASPTIRNCTFANCHDEGIRNTSGSSPLIEFCTFTNNMRFGVDSVQSTPFISQCLFINNSGTCVYNSTNSTGSGSILNCVFVGNTSTGSSGAAIQNVSGGSVTVGNCVFNNNVSLSEGGALYANSSTSTVYNCTFQGNTAASDGGAISAHVGNTLLINCTVVENRGTNGSGGLVYFGSGGSVNVKNCIFWDNTDLFHDDPVETAQIDDLSGGVTVRNSIVKGLDGFTGPGNIGFKPLFVNQAGGNLRLLGHSPGLNAGDNSAVTNIATDLAGAARISQSIVDMGAYESTTPQSGLSQAPMTGSASVCSGKNFIFTIDGAGFVGNTYAGVKAVWQLDTGAGFTNISTNATYRVSTDGNISALKIVNATAALNGYKVRFVLTATNAYNPIYTIYTSPATTLSVSAPGGVIYVNAAATNGGNGLSWATAFNDLQTTLNYNGCSSEIWVAAGTYRPTAGSDRGASFNIPAGTAIYGGFAGNEAARNQRNWTNNPTILSGDIGAPGDGTDNSFDVVVLDGLQNPMTTNTIVDGVIVENGVTGMTLYYSDAAIQNCVIRNQSGTGMDITGGSPALTACSFTANAGEYGGGLYLAFGNPMILNCRFSGNSATYGGGIYTLQSSPRLFNCLISGNAATSLGGGTDNEGASPILINCTISGNSSQSQYGGGGGLGGQLSLVAMNNCIVWNNSSTGANLERSQIYNINGTNQVAYSCIDGLNTLAGNNNNGNDPRLILELDPASAPSVAGNFRLQDCSPLINAGNNAVVAGVATDLDGGLRTYGTNVDVGAYELQSNPTSTVVLTQDPASFTYCSTGSNYFGVVVSGAGLRYQWQVNTGSGFVSLANDTVYSGVTTPTLALSNAPPSLNGAAYRCAISSASGCTFHSRSATLTIYPSRLYVNAAAVPGGNGWSWATALANLDAALAATADNCNLQIWMAAGNYPAPSPGFTMENHVAIYGGFNGTETSLAQRNWITNQTILSGAGNNVINNPGSTPIDNTAVLDGCIVQNGVVGIFNFQNCSPVIANCTVRSNSSAGIANVNHSAPTFFNCLIERNGSLSSQGGGMYNSSSSSAKITNCVFRGNIADTGGALRNSSSQPAIENCVFSGNYSPTMGGAIYNTVSGTVIIRNCSFTGNRTDSSYGGAGIFTDSAMELYNSIVWNNVAGSSSNELAQIYPLNTSMTVSATCFQGFSNNVYRLRGNLDVDPQFYGPISPFSAPSTSGNFHLLECSSLLNAGSNVFLGTWPFDLDGNPRVYNGAVDMGAYEAQYSSTPVTILTQPVSFTYCSSSSSNGFTASASGPGSTYQWEVGDSTNGFVPVSGPLYSGANTTNLVIAGATSGNNGYQYRCAITSSNGCTFRTTNATLTINNSRYCVNPLAATNGTGTSWANAFNSLQSALAAPKDACGVEIWMAVGTNIAPSTGFLMTNNTAIYGGFNGTETSFLQRDWRTNFTVLKPSADLIINNDGNFTPINSSAVIDGFVLIGANNSPTASRAILNNVNANVTIQNCTFRSNSVAIENFISSPTIRNCLFEYNGRSTNNTAAPGGGIYDRSTSSPLVDHCVFRANETTSGAGMHQAGSGSPVLLNCVFSGNHATSDGGAISLSSGSMTLYHCTIVGNKTDGNSGAGISSSVAMTVLNSIISSNYANTGANYGESAQVTGSSITISNSCLQGLTSTNYLGKNNTGANPLLVGAVGGTSAPTTNGDFHLSPCSPAIGAGANAYTGGITTDIDGNPRLFGSSVDMGAHELQGNTLQIVTQPVDQSGDKDVSILFSVAANYTNVTYQWQVNSGNGFTNLADNSAHLGSTNATLVLTNETFSMNSNQYRCRVISGPTCEAVSSSARFFYHETINDPPTNIVLSTNSVLESAPIGTAVGTFTVTDPDFQDSALCSLISGTGSTDNAAFTIVSNILKTAVTLNYETQTNYSIRVRATDLGGLFFEKVFTITVINVNDEFPIISGSSAVSFAENNTNVVATYTATDPDPGDSITWLLSGIDATNFTLIAGTLRFITPPDYEAPRDANQDNVYLINIGARDTASHTSTLAVVITVLNVADGPYFVSTPVTNAVVGNAYAYPVVAAHPLGLPIDITAPQLPSWLTLDFSATANTLIGGIQTPVSVAVNSAGTVYAGDSGFPAKIHRITPAGVDTLESVSVGYPIGIAASHTATNTYYFADYINNSINRVVSGGVANTYGVTGPSSLAVDQSGNMYYTLNADNFIGKITPAGSFSVLAGSSTAGFQNGTGGGATFDHPSGLAVDSAGTVYVADYNNHAIRKVTSAGVVTTLAGNGTAGSTDATGANATFNYPSGIAVDAAGYLYVDELGSGKIRKITPAGVVTTVIQYAAYGLAVNAAGNTIYLADGNNNAVVKIQRATFPTLTGVPAKTNAGVNAVTLVASDGTQSTNQQFNIIIPSANHAPVANSQSLTNLKNSPVNIVLTGSDSDNDPLTFVVNNPPTNGVLTGTPPNLTYTPATNFVGVDTFTFHATDGETNSLPATISLTIVPPVTPIILTQLVTGVTNTAAVLNATVNPNGIPTGVYFQYGLTAAYASTSPTQSLASAALNFDGISQSASETLTGLNQGNSAHTIEAWLRPTLLPDSREWVLLLGAAGVGAHHWLLQPDGSTQIGVFGGNQVDPTLAPNVWTHLAASFDGSTYRVYTNGVLVGATNAAFNLSGGALTLAQPLADESYYGGGMDDLRIWNTARTAAQIQSNYNATLTGTEPGLLAWLRMDAGSGSTLADASGHGNSVNNSTAAWTNGPPLLTTVTQNLSGLSPGTTYHFRTVAASGPGLVFGNDLTFTTTGPRASAPLLVAPTRLGNGSFQFDFTNTPSASFTVLCTTNLSLPLSNWTVFTNVVESPAGLFRFTDPQATNGQRFYRVRSP